MAKYPFSHITSTVKIQNNLTCKLDIPTIMGCVCRTPIKNCPMTCGKARNIIRGQRFESDQVTGQICLAAYKVNKMKAEAFSKKSRMQHDMQ